MSIRVCHLTSANVGEYPYVYYWHRCGRKGQPCKVTARGAMNSIRVEFEDGFKMITSRYAVRKLKAALPKR